MNNDLGFNLYVILIAYLLDLKTVNLLFWNLVKKNNVTHKKDDVIYNIV